MDVLRFRTESEWIEAALRAFRHAARAARDAGVLRLCLAGGRTPESVYRALAGVPLRGLRVELWPGDEREVDPDSPDRNGGLVLRTFRECGWDPPPVVRLWPAAPAAEACREMEARLRNLPEPFFGLSFLGVGEDGHTAGVFPGGRELREVERLALPSRAPSEPRSRMTLSPRALASTRGLRFLLRGPAKLATAERLARDLPEGTEGAAGDLAPAELVALRTRAAGAEVSLLYCET